MVLMPPVTKKMIEKVVEDENKVIVKKPKNFKVGNLKAFKVK